MVDTNVPVLSRRGHSADPAVLELLGQKASSMYLDKGINLNDAIVKLASGSDLAPEHVKRVVEFANGATHDRLFKESADKLFEFPLADTRQVLKDLHSGAGGKLPQPSPRDAVEMAMPKIASQEPYFPGVGSATLEELFAHEKTAEYEYANPFAPASELLDRCQAAEEEVRSRRTGVHILLNETRVDFEGQVKQASMGGLSLRDIFGALDKVSSHQGILKAACARVAAQLKDEPYFRAQNQLEKTASGEVNTEHPMAKTYKILEELVLRDTILEKAAAKLAEKRARVETFLRDKLRNAQ